MFKFSPRQVHKALNLLKNFLLGIIVSIFFAGPNVFAEPMSTSAALIQDIVDDQTLIAISDTKNWEVGEIVPVISANAKIGVFAFAEVSQIKPVNSKYELRLKLIRQSRKYMILKGDYVKRVDLSTIDPEYIGTTDLLIKKSQMNVSSRYKPLVYQGIFIGETAQLLYKNEFLLNIVGNLQYGLSDWMTVSTFTTLNVLGGPNASIKTRLYDSETTTLSTGISFVRVIQEDQATVNLNLYWDSTSSEALISHTFLGLGLIHWDGAAEASAIKALGSSSFQTGYELILSNWDRFLIGPNYNFEKKTLGGYLSYVWIYDRFHLQLAVNATDITKFRYDTKDGYFLNFDMFWRF